MTTVFEAPDLVGRRTHVLIIGVGKYPYGIGGAHQKPSTFGLIQLTSPPISAKALIDWFLGPELDVPTPGFNNPSAPLATLEALISSDQPQTIDAPRGAILIDGATAANVQAAFDRWLDRVKADEGSTAILYFCGHGQTTDRHYVFFEDVLANDNRRFENGFDVAATHFALRTVAKNSQIHFWIDACREVSSTLMLQTGNLPQPLIGRAANAPTIEKATSILSATGTGKTAFAKEGKVSRFTSAIIKSMSGYAGTKRSGGGAWQVKAQEMSRAVADLLDGENRTAERKQWSSIEMDGDAESIVESHEHPKATVSLDLLPEHLREHGEVFLQHCDARNARITRPCRDGKITVDVPKGYYDIGARSTAAAFGDEVLRYEEIIPPLYDYTFKVV
jgi:hypothetical protein